MRPAGHRIDIDPDRELMRVTLWGDWANMREKTLTEEMTIAEFKKSFEADSPSRRTAIIVSPELPTSMAERIAPPGRVLITYTEDDALAWLFEPA